MEKNDFEKIVSSLKEKEKDFSRRTISYNGERVEIFYIAEVTDKDALRDNIIKPLVNYCSETHKPLNAQETKDSIIYTDYCIIESGINKIEQHLLNGYILILFSTDKEYIVANLKMTPQRAITTPQLSYTVRGPQDCFNENLDTNLALLKYRIKDKNMRIKKFEVGVRTKTRVVLISIEDITNDIVVQELQKRIERINVDEIVESGELQSFLLNNKLQLFPNMGLVERSDMAARILMKGKALILVEGSPIGIFAPKTFTDFFFSSDDVYDNYFFAAFARLIRYFALFISLTASSLYVAIVSFHTDILPLKYVIALAEMRGKVPFSAFTGALLLEIVMELLREALLRVPKQIGSAIGIVGTIVIGQAAISAGIFSPLLLIVVSLSLLSSFTISDYSLINPIRILKFGLLIMTATLGFYGFILFMVFILCELVSLNSFGVPYMAPWAPFNFYDSVRTVFSNTIFNPYRPVMYRTKDKIRKKENKGNKGNEENKENKNDKENIENKET